MSVFDFYGCVGPYSRGDSPPFAGPCRIANTDRAVSNFPFPFNELLHAGLAQNPIRPRVDDVGICKSPFAAVRAGNIKHFTTGGG